MSSIDSAIGSVLAAKDSAVKSQIGFAVQAKMLTASKQQGEAVNQLLQAAAELSKAVGKGLRFDALG